MASQQHVKIPLETTSVNEMGTGETLLQSAITLGFQDRHAEGGCEQLPWRHGVCEFIWRHMAV